MFFYLSKTINYLTMPMVIIGILLLLSILLKNKKRRSFCLYLGIGSFLFFSNDFVANEVATLWELPATPFIAITKKYDYGIVLTGVTRLDLEPTDRTYFGRGADRVTHTVQLYKLNLINQIVISGGNGSLLKSGKQEADDLAAAMIVMGVPKEAIIIEKKSRNTHESTQALTVLMGEKLKQSNNLLITSSYHMRRSRACFKKVGIEVDTVSTDFITHPRKYTPNVLIIPQVDALANWQIMIHEWTGMIAYKLAGYI
jgi:uncharacterized SAM-binding protein YcdF (DUF218 family)